MTDLLSKWTDSVTEVLRYVNFNSWGAFRTLLKCTFKIKNWHFCSYQLHLLLENISNNIPSVFEEWNIIIKVFRAKKGNWCLYGGTRNLLDLPSLYLSLCFCPWAGFCMQTSHFGLVMFFFDFWSPLLT